MMYQNFCLTVLQGKKSNFSEVGRDNVCID
jgi:hypothetical protein